MCSLEIFDAKQMKWIPYVPDYKKYTKHFEDISDGYAKPDRRGYFVVGIGDHYREHTSKPNVQLVTPVAQGIEIAKSEIEHRKKAQSRKRKNVDTIAIDNILTKKQKASRHIINNNNLDSQLFE